jgi:hypothetical protein
LCKREFLCKAGVVQKWAKKRIICTTPAKPIVH